MPRGRKSRLIPKTVGSRLALDFLKREGMTQALFAESCKIGRNTLNEYLSGRRRPQLDDAFAIQDQTRGEVPARAWLLLLTVAKPSKAARVSNARRAKHEQRNCEKPSRETAERSDDGTPT